MKFFSISCCGFTMTARTTSSQVTSSPSEENLISSPTRSGTIWSTARSKSHQCRFSDPCVMPIRQTRSELGLAADPSRPPRRKSGRAIGSAASALQYAEWSPSLCTIAEDNVVGKKSHRHRTITIERVVKQKSGRETKRANQSRSHTDDYGRASVTLIPAFAPTPFMFRREWILWMNCFNSMGREG